MIQAVLEGKSLGYEYTEDILTSTVFGTLKYLRPDMILIPFIESAFLYNDKRTTLWEKLNSEGIELRCYREVEYVFWTWNQDYGEPDLILIFSDMVLMTCFLSLKLNSNQGKAEQRKMIN
ncbi:MAG: hypothetical protein JM58_03030 [Peptococcaceae bacterium BICA1-8]|nr:MAG: hypothetical protein JM58_03030 [Peptococcaceae bacterium BICA1-8]